MSQAIISLTASFSVMIALDILYVYLASGLALPSGVVIPYRLGVLWRRPF